MHQIEEILKQLNEKSAVIQPGTVELLATIQDRLMRRSGQQLPPENEDAASVTSPQINREKSSVEQSSVGETGTTDRNLAIQDSANQMVSRAQETRVQEAVAEFALEPPLEISPLLRSIMDSNLKLRSDHEQSVTQPRFLAQKSAAVNAAAFHGAEMGSELSSDVAEISPTNQYSIDRSVDYGFQTDDFQVPVDDDASAWAVDDLQDTVSVKFPADNTIQPIREPAESKKNKTPIPHFDRPSYENRSRNVERQTSRSVGDRDSKLPLFDSVWFRRSAPTKPIHRIVDSIINKVPPVAPATLQFTQSIESKADGAQIVTQVAWELSRRVDDDVLLVDADFQLREISRQLENVYLPGLGEVLNRDEAAAGLVRKTGVDRLYWLPSGQSDVSFRKTTPERWSQISAELKSRFQYVCIYSGGAEEKVAATWSRFCDFTFLMASMSDDLGPATEELIAYLRKHDSRVSGLITVD